MIGRAAWKKPWDTLGDADRTVFGAAANPAASRRQVGAHVDMHTRAETVAVRSYHEA